MCFLVALVAAFCFIGFLFFLSNAMARTPEEKNLSNWEVFKKHLKEEDY